MGLKFTVEMPVGLYCEARDIRCPCLGLDGCESDHCGYFNVPLDLNGRGKVLKCQQCRLLGKMLTQEGKK